MDKKEFIIPLYIRVLLILLVVNISQVLSQDIYKSIRVWNPNPEKIQVIQKLGVALDHSITRPGSYVDIVISETEEKILLSNGIIFTTLIGDLTSYYQSQNIPAMQRDFPLGTMQGNYTWEELNQRFDELNNPVSYTHLTLPTKA